MLAGLPYVVWPFGSFFILASPKKEDPFLYYHAVQALLAGVALGFSMLVAIVGMFICFRLMPTGTVPENTTEIVEPVWSATMPALFSGGVIIGGGFLMMSILLVAIFLGWRATEGEMLRLPFLGDIAEEKMLDQTGMTRRQFEAMLEASMNPQSVEEEIPFPELEGEAPQHSAPSQERAIDRLEAARQARAAQHQREEEQRRQEAARLQQARQTRQLEQRQPASGGHGGHSTAGYGHSHAPQREVASQQANPVIREVDLIGHYKETQLETGPDSGKKADVLRQWLSDQQ